MPGRRLVFAMLVAVFGVACGEGPSPERSTRGDLRVRSPGEADAGYQIGFSFGEVAVGTSSRVSFELVNVGADAARISSTRFVDTPAGIFFVQSPASVSPGDTDAVAVTFTPRAPGEQTGRLVLDHDGNAPAVDIALSGIGR